MGFGTTTPTTNNPPAPVQAPLTFGPQDDIGYGDTSDPTAAQEMAALSASLLDNTANLVSGLTSTSTLSAANLTALANDFISSYYGVSSYAALTSSRNLLAGSLPGATLSTLDSDFTTITTAQNKLATDTSALQDFYKVNAANDPDGTGFNSAVAAFAGGNPAPPILGSGYSVSVLTSQLPALNTLTPAQQTQLNTIMASIKTDSTSVNTLLLGSSGSNGLLSKMQTTVTTALSSLSGTDLSNLTTALQSASVNLSAIDPTLKNLLSSSIADINASQSQLTSGAQQLNAISAMVQSFNKVYALSSTVTNSTNPLQGTSATNTTNQLAISVDFGAALQAGANYAATYGGANPLQDAVSNPATILSDYQAYLTAQNTVLGVTSTGAQTTPLGALAQLEAAATTYVDPSGQLASQIDAAFKSSGPGYSTSSIITLLQNYVGTPTNGYNACLALGNINTFLMPYISPNNVLVATQGEGNLMDGALTYVSLQQLALNYTINKGNPSTDGSGYLPVNADICWSLGPGNGLGGKPSGGYCQYGIYYSTGGATGQPGSGVFLPQFPAWSSNPAYNTPQATPACGDLNDIIKGVSTAATKLTTDMGADLTGTTGAWDASAITTFNGNVQAAVNMMNTNTQALELQLQQVSQTLSTLEQLIIAIFQGIDDSKQKETAAMGG